MPVGGSRHYQGSGLGQEGIWGCPSCGEDNTTPIAQGCTHCGAGRPGHRAAAEPPPPAAPTPPPAAPAAPAPEVGQGDIADWWAREHPEATVAEAYRTGVIDGMRAARAATAAAQAAAPPEGSYIPDAKINRTIIAALALFREQVLVDEPNEIAAGEWLSVMEVDQLIEHLQRQVQIQEPAHV